MYVCEQQKHIRDETRAEKFDFIVYYVFRLRNGGVRTMTKVTVVVKRGCQFRIFVNSMVKLLNNIYVYIHIDMYNVYKIYILQYEL